MSGGWLDSLGGLLPGTTQNLDPSSAANPAGAAGISIGTGTGRFGTIPMQSNLGGGTVGNVVQEFKDWLDTPFKTPLDPMTLVIVVGTIMVAIIGWNFILYHVRIAAETI